MRYFVTGGTGFIGSRLIRRVVATVPEVSVHALVRPGSDRWRLADLSDCITFHEGDITDPDSLVRALSVASPTHLFHFANAGVYGGVSVSAEESLAINAGGLKNLLAAARPHTYESFVNIGSSSEYGLTNAPMKETDVCKPVSGYGAAKLAATQAALLEAKTYDKPIATFRVFSPFGPHDDASRLIPRAITNLHAGKSFPLPHERAVRDYGFVDDVVALLLEAAATLGSYRGEIFNAGTGTETNAVAMVEEIARLLHAEELFASLPRNQGELAATESPRWVADMQKTFSAFSARPTTTLSEGLTKTIAFVKEHREHYPV